MSSVWTKYSIRLELSSTALIFIGDSAGGPARNCVDELRVGLRRAGFVREFGGRLVRGAVEGLEQQTQSDACIAFAQVQVRGQLLGAPPGAERGGIRAGCQQGFGQDFTGGIYKMHHL